MSAFEFTAKIRDTSGSAASRRIRREADLPGVVYGPDIKPQSITCSHHQMYQLLKNEKFHSSIVSMNLEGKTQKVLLRDYQTHPYKPLLMHIDFQMVSDKREVHMTVPLHFVGAELSPGVKVGHGLASHVMVEIDIACMPSDLPSYIEVDMSSLNVGQSIHARELKMPQGVKLAISKMENPVVCAVLSPLKEEVVTATAVPTEAAPVSAKAGAKPAAPAKPAAKK